MNEHEWFSELANLAGVTVDSLYKHPLPIQYLFDDGFTPQQALNTILNIVG